MHAVIFLGFMSLLLRKLQLIAIGYDEIGVVPGRLRRAVRGVQGCDRAGRRWPRCCYAFYRRFVLRPARLERNREALLVLSLIAGDHGDRLRVRRLPLRARSPSASRRSRTSALTPSSAARSRAAFSALSPAALQAGYVLAYWTQMVVVFSLPRAAAGRRALPHRHRAADALYFRRGRPGQPRAGGRPREADGGDRRGRHAGRRAHRARPHLEGRARCLHLHRMRPLQGRLPDPPHRQAAVAEVASTTASSTICSSSARRSSPATRRGAAGARAAA